MSNPPLGSEGTEDTPPAPATRDQEQGAERGLVWIVDDSPLEAEMARRALSPRYTIEVFTDGATMLERLASGPGPDTIVLDWQLPGMDGIDVCRFLRGSSDEVALPVVMLTAHGHKQDIVEGLAAGANDYVTKPYDPAELLARVGTLVRTRRLHERARRAERALGVERDRLLQSERELRTVAEAIPQIVWTAGAGGRLEHFNRRWFEYTGTTPGQSLDAGWRSALHPDDMERAVERWRSAVETGADFDIQYRLRRADGVHHWFLGRALPLRKEGGAILKWFGTLTDIDEHKRAERSLDLLARAGDAISASLDSKATSESMARLAVPALADWCGVYLRDDEDGVARVADASAGDAPAPALLRDLTASHPVHVGAHSRAQKLLRTGEPELVPDIADALSRAGAGDAVHLAKLREASVTSWMMVPLAVQQRTFGCLTFAIVGSGRRYDEADLSLALELGRRTAVAIDNARLFEMAQRERVRVEEANHAKDEFLATVSHELRTPLNSILGWSVLLRSETMSEERRSRALATIERSARSQTQLIEDLLDISRIVSGKLRLNVAPVQMSAVIGAAIEIVRPAAEAKGVRLQPFLDGQVGPIRGDSERLQQVIWNLLANAVKFTPKGGQVQVSLSRDGSDVEIAVADTGAGISPGFLPYVFERFRQADTGIVRAHGGLGLGLAITRHLVELHGGSIKALSPGEGLGATILLRIPLAPLRPTAIESTESIERPSGHDSELPPPVMPSPPEIVGLHVLLVEDEPDARELMATVLESCGVRVTAVASAAEALDAMRSAPPDVLVSDVGMPGESGYDLIRKIRLLPADQGGRTPAVALTAYARMEDRTRALMLGFDLHLAKPIEPSELLVVIAHLASRFPKT